MKYDVFISYNHKDHKQADSLTKKLKDKGFSVFFAPESLVAGKDWAEQIKDAIENASDFLMLVTENYSQSDVAIQELELAVHKGVRILPIMLEQEKISDTLKFYIGNVSWITGSYEEASDKAVAILAEEKREREKAEILNRAYESWNYGDFYAAEMDINALLRDPVYENDAEVNYQLAELWEDERIYYPSMSVNVEQLIDLYRKILRYSSQEKHKFIIEQSKQAIERLTKESAAEKEHLPKASTEDTFVLAVLTSRMEAAERFEELMGSDPSTLELNCLLTDYRQMTNFCSFFRKEIEELIVRERQCKDKIVTIKQKLEKGDNEPGKETLLVKAYRSYLGIGRPEAPMYDVFISCKSEDQKYAQRVYDFLLINGKRPFFSKETVSEQGNSEYHDAIMSALDHSKHFILVSSRLDYVNSSWVKHEWTTYVGEAVEGRKNGNMILVFHEDFHFEKTELPIDIRRKEILSLSSFRVKLLDYIN